MLYLRALPHGEIQCHVFNWPQSTHCNILLSLRICSSHEEFYAEVATGLVHCSEIKKLISRLKDIRIEGLSSTIMIKLHELRNFAIIAFLCGG